MFPIGSYDIRPGHKWHETNLFSRESNILHGIPQWQQGCKILQNVVETHNHFIFVAKNFYCHGFNMLIVD